MGNCVIAKRKPKGSKLDLLWTGSSGSGLQIEALKKYDMMIMFVLAYDNGWCPCIAFSPNQKYGQGMSAPNYYITFHFTKSTGVITIDDNNGMTTIRSVWGIK